MKNITIAVDDELFGFIDKLAIKEDRRRAAIVKRILIKEMEREKSEGDES